MKKIQRKTKTVYRLGLQFTLLLVLLTGGKMASAQNITVSGITSSCFATASNGTYVKQATLVNGKYRYNGPSGYYIAWSGGTFSTTAYGTIGPAWRLYGGPAAPGAYFHCLVDAGLDAPCATPSSHPTQQWRADNGCQSITVAGSCSQPPPLVTNFSYFSNQSMSSARFSIQFSSAVSGLTASDFSIAGTAPGASISSISSSGTNWFVHVNTGTGTGTINLSLNTSSGTTISNLPYASTTITKPAMNPGTLSLGDIVFTSYFTDGGHRFSFVNLVDIPANESIYFTDHGWNGNSWGTNPLVDGIIEWSHSSLIPAGTQITITGLTASMGTVLNKENAASGLNLSGFGDQIFAFQGQSNLLAGLHYNVYTGTSSDASWDAGSNALTSSHTSHKPAVLTTGINAMRAGVEFDNGKLDCSGLPASSLAAFRAYANDDANWVFDDDQLTIGSGFPACASFLTACAGSAPPAPTANSLNLCTGDNATLMASGGAASYAWYDVMSGGAIVSSTDSLALGTPTSSATYYVETYTGTASTVGPTDATLGPGGNFTSLTAQQLIFTANTDFILDSVTIYPQSAGTFTVEVRDSASNLIASRLVTVTASGNNAETIYLGFHVPTGANYTLGSAGGTIGGLYRNNGGASYPYNSPAGDVSITGNTFNSNYYYYFYDWKITEACFSPRTTVTVTVDTIPVIVNATTPYCADFTAEPACWTNSGTNNWVVAYGYAEAQFWAYPAPATWIYTTPLLLVDAGMNPVLKFDWSHLYNATYPYDSLNLEISTDTGTTWTNLLHLSGPTFTTPGAQNQAPTTGAWNNEFINLFAYAGQNIQLRYAAYSDYGPDLFLDNICLEQGPSCYTPDSVTAYIISPTGASITWRENTVPSPATNWSAYLHTAPTSTPNVGSIAGLGSISSQYINVNNIVTPGNTYYFYVRSICGPGDTSAWSAPLVFTTPCVVQSFPYTEDFESGTFSNCWTQSTTDNFDWTVDQNGTTSGNTGPTSGANGSTWYLYTETSNPVTAGDTATVLSPEIDLASAVAPRLKFNYHMYGAGMNPNGTILIEITNDGGTTWTPLFTEIGEQGNQWNTACNDLVSYIGDTVQFRISGIVSTGTGNVYQNDFAIDEFSVEEAVACTAPTALTMGTITDTSALFSFTENNAPAATVWIYSYGPAGFTAGMGTQDTISSTSDSLISLLPSTPYDLYVRALCGPCDSSAWTAVASFTTLCPANNILPTPFCQGFESGDLASTCWTNATTDDFDWTIDQNGTTSSSTGPSTGAKGSNWYIYTETSSPVANGDSAVITTPDFDLNGLTNPWLTFNYHMYGAGMSPDGTIAVEISNDAGTTWSPLFSQMGEQGDVWLESCNDLMANLGDTVRFRITGVVSTTGTAYENDFAIDEFCVGEKPVLAAPTALVASNIAANSVDISWTENSTPAVSTWEVSYGAPSFTAGMGTQVATINNPTTLAIVPNTSYDVYVRVKTDCDSSAWVGPLQFTALDICGDTVYDNGGAAADYVDNSSETFIYCPANAGDKVSLTFTEFSFEDNGAGNCYDGLTFYNGSSTAAPVISSPGGTNDIWCWDRADASPTGTGDLLGATVVSTATDGCLTVVMTSDGSVQRPGFTANVNCAPAVPQYPVQVSPIGHIKADSLIVDGDGWFHYLNTTTNANPRILLSAQLGNTNTKVDSVTSHVGSGTVDLSNAPYVTNSAWHVMSRTWNMAVNTQPTVAVPVRTYYSTADYNALVAVPGNNVSAHTDLHFFKINNGKDELLANGHANVTSADYEEFEHGTGWTYSMYGGAHRAEYSVTQFSGGGGGGNFNGNGALPVELTNFTAYRNGNVNAIRWTTAMEQNNAYFNVERSTNGSTDFENIGRVYTKATNGNSDRELNYQLDDASPEVGHNYYRLEQVDIDGQKSYSDVIDVIWAEDGNLVAIYPNPATSVLNIDLTTRKTAQTEIRLTDLSGRVVKSVITQTQKGLNHITLYMDDVATGIYSLQVYENDKLTNVSKIRKSN